ncbi:hypothetical protein SLA2020_515430 [Shorea laevis]
MVSYFKNSSSGHDFSGPFDPFPYDFGAFDRGCRSGPVSQSLVLDSEKGELVKMPVRVEKKNVSDEKIIAALKSHSEAERRRRERINAHLDTLRGLVPCREKMDKATLLAEVVRQVKELKNSANEASKGFLIPMDIDKVSVEQCNDENDETEGTFAFKASICCDYNPELLTNLRQALEDLQLKMVKAEMSTLGDRIRNDFVFSSCRTVHVDPAQACQLLKDSIHYALSSVLENTSASPEYSPRATLLNKRQRISFISSSGSSSLST